ncbi:DUF6934 family protein [Mucilaginibacter sp.]|uniref:DUF6934 family protein n=1 Tax=Mucilaginibacter sp. TaxID=1882438 RepID=UPI00284935C2|nr:hypothetical protein [Mucilaginibacter sp.]MDR3693491.1 hypothetical protein [Mucilaginibacter sp.]
MNLDHYTFFTTDFQEYEFFSEGPQGRIKKIVRYRRISNDPVTYNLAFGDENEKGVVSDTVISNNRDKDMVLTTVANTINAFSDHYGNHFIYAEGSTAARTRLYQMGIARLWEAISMDFDVWGYKDDSWQDFRINVNYDAFLVKRK